MNNLMVFLKVSLSKACVSVQILYKKYCIGEIMFFVAFLNLCHRDQVTFGHEWKFGFDC